MPPIHFLDEPNYFLMGISKWNPAKSILSLPVLSSVSISYFVSLSPGLCFPRACDLNLKGKATSFWPPSISTHLNIQEFIIITHLLFWTKIQFHIFFWMIMKIRENEKEAFVLYASLWVIKWLYKFLLTKTITRSQDVRVCHILMIVLSVLLCLKVLIACFWWEACSMASVKAGCSLVTPWAQKGHMLEWWLESFSFKTLVSSHSILSFSSVIDSLLIKSNCERTLDLIRN